MHIARLKQRNLGRSDFTCIRIVPMHGFMKNSDYSCTVTMHVQKIQKIEVGPIEHPSVVAGRNPTSVHGTGTAVVQL